MDSAENHTAASLLNPEGCCSSSPVFSDVRGWTSELRPQHQSVSLRVQSQKAYHDTCITNDDVNDNKLKSFHALDDKTV